MYEDLVEKLVEVDAAEVSERPVVVTEVSPEQKMHDFHKNQINSKLKGSTWITEEDWLKFWMFRNGDYLSVKHSHQKTAALAGFAMYDLEGVGMVQGSIKLNQKALSVSGEKPLTDQQRARLRQFFIEHKLIEVYVSFPKFGGIGSFGKPISSSADLDYTLEYGLDEAVATKLSPEKQMKRYHKKVLNSKLSPSTWASETDWLKFWLLSDGTHIPVVGSHAESAADADVGDEVDPAYKLLMADGAFAGSIKTDQSSLSISNWKMSKLTPRQISKLRQMYVEYKPREVYVDFKRGSKSSFRSSIANVEELDYRLEYGMDEAVATEVDPQQKLLQKFSAKVGKLELSSYKGESWYKFWMLTDGKLIPVEFAHDDTADEAGTNFADLYKEGVVRGYINPPYGELNVDVLQRFTRQQIITLVSMFVRYDIKDIFAAVKNATTRQAVKSSAELDYFLTYGTLDEGIKEAIEVPEYLYHGTFRPLLDKIKSEGLRIAGTVKNYSDSEEGLIYLAKTFEEAEAFAEVSETVPDAWVDQIVVLKIDTDKLDKSKLADDPNVRDTEVMTFIYPQDIPPGALEVVVS